MVCLCTNYSSNPCKRKFKLFLFFTVRSNSRINTILVIALCKALIVYSLWIKSYNWVDYTLAGSKDMQNLKAFHTYCYAVLQKYLTSVVSSGIWSCSFPHMSLTISTKESLPWMTCGDVFWPFISCSKVRMRLLPFGFFSYLGELSDLWQEGFGHHFSVPRRHRHITAQGGQKALEWEPSVLFLGVTHSPGSRHLIWLPSSS